MKITSKRVHILVCSTLGWGETKMCFSFPAVQFCGDLLENSSFRHRRREWQHVRNKRSSSPTARTVAPRNEPQLKRAAMAGRRRPLWGRGAPATSPEGPAAPKGPLPRGPSGRKTVESRLREVRVPPSSSPIHGLGRTVVEGISAMWTYRPFSIRGHTLLSSNSPNPSELCSSESPQISPYQSSGSTSAVTIQKWITLLFGVCWFFFWLWQLSFSPLFQETFALLPCLFFEDICLQLFLYFQSSEIITMCLCLYQARSQGGTHALFTISSSAAAALLPPTSLSLYHPLQVQALLLHPFHP